ARLADVPRPVPARVGRTLRDLRRYTPAHPKIGTRHACGLPADHSAGVTPKGAFPLHSPVAHPGEGASMSEAPRAFNVSPPSEATVKSIHAWRRLRCSAPRSGHGRAAPRTSRIRTPGPTGAGAP